MIGFYLKVHKGFETNIGVSSVSFESLANSREPLQEGLYIFEDNLRQLVQSDGYTLFNVGTLIYKNAWRQKALELVMRDLNKGRSIREIMPHTRGQFCLVVNTEDGVLVATDKLGSFPVFMFEDDRTVQISNILLPLAKRNEVSINPQAFAEYLSFNYCFGGTIFREINWLNMATIYRFGSRRRMQVYDSVFSDLRFNRCSDLNEASRAAKEILVDNLSFLNSDDKVFVDMTGGFDTRTVGALLESMNTAFEAGICGEQDAGESEVAQQVADVLGVKFNSNIKISDRHLFEGLLDEHFTMNAGVPVLYHSTELINYYKHIRRKCDIHVTGFGGTELTKQTLPKLNLFSSKIKKTSLFQKYGYAYQDIFVDGFITRTSYYRRLTEKVDSLLRVVGTDAHDKVANYLRLSTFTRCYAGCLVGTHNVIMPFYSPFIEGNYVRLMMETAYGLKTDHQIQRAILTMVNPTVSSIMTSHTYSAEIRPAMLSRILMGLRRGLKGLARRVIYQLGLYSVMKFVECMVGRIRPRVNIEHVQRLFWVSKVNESWSDELKAFRAIDRKKLKRFLARECDAPRIKAKILYLNRIIDECNPTL